MWQALRDMVDNAKQSLGIEVPAAPDTSAVTDAASDVAGQAGEAATGVGEEITSKVSDFLGRFGG